MKGKDVKLREPLRCQGDSTSAREPPIRRREYSRRGDSEGAGARVSGTRGGGAEAAVDGRSGEEREVWCSLG